MESNHPRVHRRKAVAKDTHVMPEKLQAKAVVIPQPLYKQVRPVGRLSRQWCGEHAAIVTNARRSVNNYAKVGA